MNLPKRIRIKGWNDTLNQMNNFGFEDVFRFFLNYEAKNSENSCDYLLKKMHFHWKTMKNAITKGLEKPNITTSKFIQGGAFHMKQFALSGHSLLDSSYSIMISRILAVAELNACMGKIVAAPTAGSCGIIPGVLLSVAEKHKISEKNLVESLFVAGGIGEIISIRASLSGSTHGCQAEVGSASAMAAGALVYMMEGNLEMIESAAAFALKNILGLVCDPIAGRVEIPCIKRNVLGGCNALASAEMALAGIATNIPLDEVIDAMASIGNLIPCSLKETSQGGLAITPSALVLQNQIKDLKG